MGETLTAHISGAENSADLMTKFCEGAMVNIQCGTFCTTYMIMVCIHIQSVNKPIHKNVFESNSQSNQLLTSSLRGLEKYNYNEGLHLQQGVFIVDSIFL